MGTCRRPSWIATVWPTICGKITESRDQDRSTRRSPAWFISSIKSLPDVFREVVAELENQYFLTFTPADQRPRTWHRVEVKTKKPGLTVRARKSFRID